MNYATLPYLMFFMSQPHVKEVDFIGQLHFFLNYSYYL